MLRTSLTANFANVTLLSFCRFLADRFVEGTCPFCNFEVSNFDHF